MKYLETKFEDYLVKNKEINLHPYLEKKYKDIYKNNQPNNIIFYGSPGIGKYTQAIRYISKYSKSKLKYERKINIISNKKEYNFKISDIHFEIDMNLLGCNAKLLWNDFYYHVIDIISSRPGHTGIILCKNFHKIHSELLDIFFSYMQSSSCKKINLKYIIITESLGFIPENITKRTNIVQLKRPSKNMYSKITKTKIDKETNINHIVNIKNITNNIYQLQEIERKICHKLIHLIDNYKKSQFIVIREVIYEMFIYQLNVYNCIWYILSHYISNKKLNKDNTHHITKNLYTILKYYNNNYRPIYHIETIVYMLCNIIHEL